jgi:hypothetical protein
MLCCEQTSAVCTVVAICRVSHISGVWEVNLSHIILLRILVELVDQQLNAVRV